MGVLCVTSCHRAPSGDYSSTSFISPLKVAKAILEIVFLLSSYKVTGVIFVSFRCQVVHAFHLLC